MDPGDTLVFNKVDRVFRSVADASDTVQLWLERGIRCVILDLGIDLATPAGRMFFHQLASFARTQSLLHWKPACLRRCSMNIYEVAIRILPLFPEAQIAEDEDGQIVIMTGVKKADPPPPGAPLFAASKWYLQPCIKLADYCAEQGIALDQAWAALHDSEISFGGNDDTLINEQRLCRLLGLEPPDRGRFLISLGC